MLRERLTYGANIPVSISVVSLTSRLLKYMRYNHSLKYETRVLNLGLVLSLCIPALDKYTAFCCSPDIYK